MLPLMGNQTNRSFWDKEQVWMSRAGLGQSFEWPDPGRILRGQTQRYIMHF